MGLKPYTRYAVYIACGLIKFDISQLTGPVIAQTLEEGIND